MQQRFCFRAAGLLVSLIMFCGSATAWDPEIGETPKAITNYEYVDGKPIDLSEFIGHPLILYFGADWCVPCVQYGKPATLAVYEKYKSKGVKLLFVSMDDNKFRPNKILEAQSLAIPFAMVKIQLCQPHKCPDGMRNAGDFGRIYGYPTAIVLNADGKVAARFNGGRGVASGLDPAVKMLLK